MGNRLFVGNLPYEVTEQDLRTFFEADGRSVQEVFIPTDRASGRPRGFAFVTMGSDEEARTATETLNGKELHGRAINISEARERAARAPSLPSSPNWWGDSGGSSRGFPPKSGGSRRKRRHKRIL
jgi:RNA recognition motif-containing protein